MVLVGCLWFALRYWMCGEAWAAPKNFFFQYLTVKVFFGGELCCFSGLSSGQADEENPAVLCWNVKALSHVPK